MINDNDITPNEREKKNKEYLEELLSGEKNSEIKTSTIKTEVTSFKSEISSIDYTNINIGILPSGRFYKKGTKIAIRASKVSEIQSYSMVDDNNFVDITEKMNELLSNNVLFTHPNGSKGSYRDVKDSDRIFLIFMIRELTFQGGNTLTKEVICEKNGCNKEFIIPFRATPSEAGPTTFDLHVSNESIEEYYNSEEHVYELLYGGVSWRLGPPTIGIQEDFYDEIKRNVQMGKKPDVAFMKIMPYLLYDRSSITPEGIKLKHKEFKEMSSDNSLDNLILFQGLNEVINNMTIGIKGLKMVCPECGEEVHTEMTFPTGASKLFEFENILGRFRK